MRSLFLVFLAAFSTFAQAANFVSIHQLPHKTPLPPAAGSFTYTFDTKVGFKEQYAPTGVTGCAIGFGTGGCAFPGGGSLPLTEFTGAQLQHHKEFKIFIPAGTRSLLLSGYAPLATQSAFVLRYGKEPVRLAPLSDAEYQAARTGQHVEALFSRLVKEDAEQFVVHDGSGSLRFMGGQLDANGGSTDQGQWLYVRQLSGAPLMTYQGAIDVDMPKYAAGYAAITWNTRSAPDPIDAVSGDGPAAPPPVAAPPAATATRSPTAIMSASGLPVMLGHQGAVLQAAD
ncbi:hypothetical protein [Acidovorax sp. A1169]|uniref:hypothetical protein n=1 Tax=Acidovorax sp. A1169 TaxID=3059524 RepID=UPI00273785C0|nr:hypothetical protein [Acidovorax sp. A1169]MDP4078325.1 hypothetical protein [Acidovorax sp. A1169]